MGKIKEYKMSETQEKINQIQIIQQNIQNLSMQRQQFQIQETEIESALSELEKTETSYKIIGNIMVKTDKETLKKDLQEKHEMLKIRINTIEKQEDKMREKAESLQQEVMKEIEKNGNKQTKTSGKH
jgi:prefoldin beta subunit